MESLFFGYAVLSDVACFMHQGTERQPHLIRLIYINSAKSSILCCYSLSYGNLPLYCCFTDWYGTSVGGIAYRDCFGSSTYAPVFVFPAQLANGSPKCVGEAISHESK